MKTAFGSENNKPVTVLAWVDCPVIGSPVPVKNVETAKDYELENCSHQQSFRKNVEMAKSSNSLVRSQREREGQKISAIVSNIFKLIVFQIDHVCLTSADNCRCDSYCLARVFQNLPVPPKHYGVFDVFCDFQGFFQIENLAGSHLAMCPDDRQISSAR